MVTRKPSRPGTRARTTDRAPIDASAQLVRIQSENQAFQLLEAALQSQFEGQNVSLKFTDWPKITLRFSGEGYDSTVTPEIAQALVDLQHALNRAYARTVHHSSTARSLTAEERRDINFKAEVSKGSSAITVNLGEFAEKLSLALVGKMNGTEIVITVLGLGLIAGGTVALKSWLSSRAETMKVQTAGKQAITLSEQETKRIQILAEAFTGRPALKFTEEDFGDVRREFLKSTGDADALQIQGVQLPGVDARTLATTPRTQSVDVQLNGHYSIVKIDLHDETSYRLTVHSQDGYGVFVATLNPESMTAESRERLTSGTWDRTRLYMQINGTKLRGEITTAAIVGVEWPKAKK